MEKKKSTCGASRSATIAAVGTSTMIPERHLRRRELGRTRRTRCRGDRKGLASCGRLKCAAFCPRQCRSRAPENDWTYDFQFLGGAHRTL